MDVGVDDDGTVCRVEDDTWIETDVLSYTYFLGMQAIHAGISTTNLAKRPPGDGNVLSYHRAHMIERVKQIMDADAVDGYIHPWSIR
jgi:hypothetical protein